jgi:chromosomal replication initiation ATPase DnaA
MTRSRQFALPFPHRPAYAAGAFLEAPSNAEALAWLARTADWPCQRLALWGEAGCGKTHLLHRWAEQTGAAWLLGQSLRGLPAMPTGPLAIDDADAAADEAALLHVLNAACEAGHPVLLAGREPPARWTVKLPDLASRLRAVTAVQVQPPDDDLLRVLLGRLLLERRVPVPEPVQDWIRRHLPRRVGVMREAAARLDRAQFEEGRPVTRRLAADCLGPLLTDDDEISASDPRHAGDEAGLL